MLRGLAIMYLYALERHNAPAIQTLQEQVRMLKLQQLSSAVKVSPEPLVCGP